MKYLKIDVDKIAPNDWNPNVIAPEKMIHLTERIRKGDPDLMKQPLVVRKKGAYFEIIDGEHRWRIAKEIGSEAVWCVIVETKTDEAKLDTLGFNMLRGEPDDEKLSVLIKDLLATFDAPEIEAATGMPEKDIERLLREMNPDQVDEDEIPEPPKKAVTKRGDLILLGEHRLLCGDATSKADVERLMDGKKANMVFTDPPYRLTSEKFGRKKNRKYGALDSSNVFGYDSWLRGGGVLDVMADNSRILVWECWTNTNALWTAMAKHFDVRGMIIWHATNRNNFIKNPNTGLFNKYDICIQASRGKKKPNSSPEEYPPVDLVSDTVERESRSGQSMVFGAKPISVLMPYIYVYSDAHDIVLDAFAGSGSTLIACEKAGRACYGLEIEPAHCDVIVDRWEKFTGKKAARPKRKKET